MVFKILEGKYKDFYFEGKQRGHLVHLCKDDAKRLGVKTVYYENTIRIKFDKNNNII